MEYIKKEELKEGEIYKSNFEGQGDYIFVKSGNLENNTFINVDRFSKLTGYFTNANGFKKFTNATPEEKHWLETCITADKFITFEEAMKTFIPEYVECVANSGSNFYFTVGKIYTFPNPIYNNRLKSRIVILNGSIWKFKPSTKEAYDAQFVVEKPEFILPEKFCILRNEENDKIVNNYINNISSMSHLYLTNNTNNPYLHNNIKGCCSYYKIRENHTEITFEQFKKYVLKEEIIEEKIIEPLPQFKIIESIETITKVENNEGNQFFIGDKVKLDSGVIYTIEKFKYNVSKTNILAINNIGNKIGIDKIEHYIESKVEVKETLLEKAKRLYPVGTKFKCLITGDYYIIPENVTFRLHINDNNKVYSYVNNIIFHQHYNSEIWADIIE